MARPTEFVAEEKLLCALNIFWDKGYTAASLADLTKAMQLNKSSLYNTFGDKHSLFKACLKVYGKSVEKEYTTAVEQGHDPLAKLDNVIGYIATISSERVNSCLGIKTSFELASKDPEIQAIIKAGHDQTTKLIKSLITDAQAAGQMKKDRDADTLSHMIFNSFAGLRQSYIIYGNKQLVEKMAAELKVYLRA